MNQRAMMAQSVRCALNGTELDRAPDMENPYRVSKKGNIVCALEWWKGEPAMFLMTYPPTLGRGFVVQLSRLPLYVNADGTAGMGLTPLARKAAQRMGLGEDMHTLNLICDVVMYNVPDLRSMPKAPPAPH